MKDNKKRAAAMKAGPNSTVEEIGKSAPKINFHKFKQKEVKEDLKSRYLQPMKLTTFLSLEFGPKRFDQAAGFAHHAKAMSPRTIHEWREALELFRAKPIK